MNTFQPKFTRKAVAICILSLLLIGISHTSFAQKNWVGGTGNWDDPNGWSPVGVPATTDDVVINGGDNVTVPANYSAVAKSISISGGGIVSTNSTAILAINGSIQDGIQMSGSGSQFLNNGSLRIGNISAIARFGILLFAGTFTNSGTGTIEINRTASDGIQLVGSSPAFTNNGSLKIGNVSTIGGIGIFVIPGTFTNSGTGTIEINRTAGDAIQIQGVSTSFNNNGNLKIGNLAAIGFNGIRSFGGTFTNAAAPASIEINSTTNGHAINITSSTFTNRGNLKIGNTSSITQNGIFLNTSSTFTNESGAILEIDRCLFSGILLEATTSAFTNDGTLKIGNLAAIGQFGVIQFNGTFTNSSTGSIEVNRTGADGIYKQGTSAFNNNGSIKIGNVFAIANNGINSFGGTFTNAAVPASIEINSITNFNSITNINALQINSSTFTNRGNLKIGNTSSIKQNGIVLSTSSTFTNESGAILEIDRCLDNGIQLNTTSSAFTNNGTLKIGNLAAINISGIISGGTFTNQTGGIVEINRIPDVSTAEAAVSLSSAGGFNNEGTLRIGTISSVKHGIGNQSGAGGVFTNSGTVQFGDVIRDGILSAQTVTNSSGGLIETILNGKLKVAGTLTNNSGANVTNSSTGIVTVNGTLNNSGTVTNNGNLKGSGTVVQSSAFSNTSGSFISPGQSPGQLNVTGNFDLGSSTYNAEINGTTAGTQYDVLAISGSATLTNSSLVVDWGSFTPSAGQSYTILTAGSIFGTFTSVTIPALSGLRFTVTYTTTAVIINALASSASDYYRTITSGNWNAPTTWESATDAAFTTGVVSPATLSPDFNANTITIQSPHTVTVTADITTDQTTVNSGGALIVDPNVVLLVNDGTGTDITVVSGGSMTIKSTSSGSGSCIGNSGNTTVSGNVTVERYISSLNNRAYRLLTPTVYNTPASIHANWQEAATSNNDNPKPGYGTHITGTKTDQTNGFDGTTTGQGSMFTYDQTTDAYVPISNTNGTFSNFQGYLIYIRGDRTISNITTATGSNNTTLRATGTLAVAGFPIFGLASNGGFSLVPNPFASALNWNLLYNHVGAPHTTNFENYYTYLDPNVGDRGGYVTVNDAGATGGGGAGTVNIQTGQAFFVKTKTGITSPVLRFDQADKSTTNNIDVFRTAQAAQKFTVSLYYNSLSQGRRIADGVTALYNNSYNAALDGNDAIEIANFDENIAIARAGTNLSIEERPVITAAETMPLYISNMKQKAYEWEFNPTNFAPNMVAQLVDKFTGTNTNLNINATTVVPFTVTADAASSASDRFYIQFTPGVALPVTISSVKAYQKNTGVQVEWMIQQESNMDRYAVERSANGQSFTTAGSVASKGNSNVVVNYNFFDASPLQGVNFYRIKSVDKNGKITFSEAVKVNISSAAKNAVTISPNPITGSSVAIQLNLPKGNYTLTLTNKLGQQLANKVVQHAGGITTETLEPSANFAAGIYQLKVKGNGISITEQVIKQ